MLEEVAKSAAVLAGVVFGSAAISSACWVWLRKQVFAYGGSALCGAGVILLGLSIWRSVEFGVSGTGMTFKAETALKVEVQSQVIQNVAAAQKDPGPFARVGEILAAIDRMSDSEVLKLARQMEEKLSLRPQALKTFVQARDPNQTRLQSGPNAKSLLKSWVVLDERSDKNLTDWESALTRLKQ